MSDPWAIHRLAELYAEAENNRMARAQQRHKLAEGKLAAAWATVATFGKGPEE
jgi:hypothetical protein